MTQRPMAVDGAVVGSQLQERCIELSDSLRPENISRRPVCIRAMCTAKTPTSSGEKVPSGFVTKVLEPGALVGVGAVSGSSEGSAERHLP